MYKMPKYKMPKYKMIAAMLVCASLSTLTVVDAQDKPSEHKGKTQSDIGRERMQACEGLRDQAMQECLDNYVGPSRDANTSEAEHTGADGKVNGAGDKKKKDVGEDAAQSGAANVDMTKSNKRGPVGPMRDRPQDPKQ